MLIADAEVVENARDGEPVRTQVDQVDVRGSQCAAHCLIGGVGEETLSHRSAGARAAGRCRAPGVYQQICNLGPLTCGEERVVEANTFAKIADAEIPVETRWTRIVAADIRMSPLSLKERLERVADRIMPDR